MLAGGKCECESTLRFNSAAFIQGVDANEFKINFLCSLAEVEVGVAAPALLIRVYAVHIY